MREVKALPTPPQVSATATPETAMDLREVQFLRISNADDVGALFVWRDRLFRAVNKSAEARVRSLFESGLIDELARLGLFPSSGITGYTLSGYGLVIEHEQIVPVSYPFEWSFAMLRDAALLVLAVNRVARTFGYQTKDAHPFNVVFAGPSARYVDLGSFIPVSPQVQGWTAYEEFLRALLYPLRIWARGGEHVARAILTNDAALLPHAEYYLHSSGPLRLLGMARLQRVVSLYFRAMAVFDVEPARVLERFPGFPGRVLSALVRRRWSLSRRSGLTGLEKTVGSLRKKGGRSKWGRYHGEFVSADGRASSTPRFDRVREIVRSLNVETIVELGGNQGVLSRMLLDYGVARRCTCIDADNDAVDALYAVAKDRIPALTPVLLDCMFPATTSLCSPPHERFRSDVVIALALTHHLILGTGLRIPFVLESIARYTQRYALVEFMPLGLWDGTSAPVLPAWYDQQSFRAEFERRFEVKLVEQLEPNRILYVGELRDPHSNLAGSGASHGTTGTEKGR